MEPRLALYLRSFSGLSLEDIEEILQQVLIALWRREGAESGPTAWIYAVARNAAIDALRSRKGRGRRGGLRSAGVDDSGSGVRPGVTELRSPVLLEGDMDVFPSAGPGPEDEYLGAEERAFVRRFVAGQDDKDREILHLAYVEESSYREISELTGMPIGTVKWRVSRLKRRLARRYRREFQ